MDLLSVLKNVQDLRATLEAYHITSGWLLAVAAVALFFFVLSTREVLGWYLRTNHLRDEVRALRKQIEAMQEMIDSRAGHRSGGGSGGGGNAPGGALDDEDPVEKKSGRVRLSAHAGGAPSGSDPVPAELAAGPDGRLFKLDHWRKSL